MIMFRKSESYLNDEICCVAVFVFLQSTADEGVKKKENQENQGEGKGPALVKLYWLIAVVPVGLILIIIIFLRKKNLLYCLLKNKL